MLRCWFLLLVLSVASLAETPKIGKNEITIRGHIQEVYYTPARGIPEVPNVKVLLASGADGWKPFIAGLAQSIASWGHDVYGLDSRAYVGNVRSPGPQDVAADMREMAAWILGGAGRKAVFIGWGEGARLGVLAVAAPDTAALFSGLIAIGLPENTAPKLPQVSMPFVMVASSFDSPGVAAAERELFEDAREPKRMRLIDAGDQFFGGNRRVLLDALHDSIGWVAQKSQ
jgi:hypothetical protein